MRQYIILIIALILGVLLMGCTTQPTATTTPSAPTNTQVTVASTPVASGPEVTVLIEDKAFNPSQLTIAPGTTVVWKNDDKMDHRVVHIPGNNQEEIFHSDRFSPGQSFSFTFTKAGRYYYSDPQYAGGRNSYVDVK
jgi:plastocyanin